VPAQLVAGVRGGRTGTEPRGDRDLLPNTEPPTVTDAVLPQINEIIAAMNAEAGITCPAA